MAAISANVLLINSQRSRRRCSRQSCEMLQGFIDIVAEWLTWLTQPYNLQRSKALAPPCIAIDNIQLHITLYFTLEVLMLVLRDDVQNKLRSPLSTKCISGKSSRKAGS